MCALPSFFPRPAGGEASAPDSASARSQGPSSLGVCAVCSLRSVPSCSERLAFLLALSKEDSQCVSEGAPLSPC